MKFCIELLSLICEILCESVYSFHAQLLLLFHTSVHFHKIQYSPGCGKVIYKINSTEVLNEYNYKYKIVVNK
jgi:hypothetical protein